MDKGKILEMSRKEKKDEGYEIVEDKGRRLGYKMFLIICIFLMIFNLLNGESSYAIMSLFWCFIFAESYSRYKFLNDKKEMITFVSSGIASVVFLINHIIRVLW